MSPGYMKKLNVIVSIVVIDICVFTSQLIFYHFIKQRTEFGYKLVCNQLATTHYVVANKIIHVYFNHMTYLMSHITL